MQRRISLTLLVVLYTTAIVGGLVVTQIAMAQAPSAPKTTQEQRAVVEMDRTTFHEHLKALGYQSRGGISKEKTDSSDPRFRSLPHFSSSFTIKGTTFPFTMLGFPPKSGRPS